MGPLDPFPVAALIGRERELTRLRAAIGDAAAGRGGCVLLMAEAGSGKTRLLREVGPEAERAGLAVLRGEAPAVVASPAWGVIGQALRSWTRRAPPPGEDLAPFAPGLRRVLPEWPGPDRVADLSDESIQMLILEGALRMLIAAAGEHGALVLLDDLQEADAESLRFLHHAASAVHTERILIVGAIRTGEHRAVEEDLRDFERRGLAHLIEVSPLSAAEVSDLVTAIIGADAPGGLVADVVARSDGVPLLVEHAIEAHRAAGTLTVQDGVVRWSGDVRAPVSRTTVGFAERRLAPAGQEVRALLTAAAITGRFDAWLLGAITEVDERSVAQTLRTAAATGLIEVTGETTAFRHALIREAVASLAGSDEAMTIHNRAADAIAARGVADAGWLEAQAHHLEALGDAQGAARSLVRAGRDALGSHAALSAEVLARKAMCLHADAAARALLADALGHLGRFQDALEIDRAGGDDADPERAERMARNAAAAGRLDDATVLIERAVASGARPEPLRALSALVALWRGRLDEAAAQAEQALRECEAIGDMRSVCAALDVLGRAADAAGDREGARSAFGRWATIAGAAGLTGSRLQALMELGNLDFMSGEGSESLREARALASEAGVFTTLVLADLSLVWWLGHRAAVPEAISLGEEAIDLCRRFGLDLLPHALVATGWAREHASAGTGEALLDEAIALAPGDIDIVILEGWTRGDAALRAGRPLDALGFYDAATEQMRRSPSAVPPPVPFMRVCAMVAAGDGADVPAALEEARSSGALPRLYTNPMWLAVAEALAAGSVEALERAADIASVNGSFNRAMALTLGAVTIGGVRAEAWLRDALAVFDGAGSTSDAARVRKLMREMGLRVPRTRKAAEGVPAELQELRVTRSEYAVLLLLADGLSNPEIAQRQFLSVRTVEDKVSSLLQKLEVTNRAGLIARGLALRSTAGAIAPHRARQDPSRER